MLHFNHGSKQEANEGNASAAGNAGTGAAGVSSAGAVDAAGAGAGAPNIPTPPEGYQQAAFASTLPTITDQTANLGSQIGVISPSESEEDAEAREAYESLARHRKARRKKKLIKAGITAGVFVLLVTLFILPMCQGGQNQNTTVMPSTTFVTRGEFSDSVSASGFIKPVSSTVVTPEVDGIIQDVQVSEGTYVHKGDKLFTIKNDELDKAVRKASQQVKAAENEVSKARSALASARNGVPEAGEDGQEANAASNAASVAAAVEAAEANLESAQIALEEARSAYNDAIAQADKRVVTAPCDGTVIVMNAVNGASVGSSTPGAGNAGPLITIADLSQMKVNVQINEVDISRIAVDQKAQVSFTALRDLYCDAVVTHVSAVSSNGADAGASYDNPGRSIVSYTVDLLISSPDASIKPGMTANVDIMIQHMDNVLTVPLVAVMDDGDGAYVNVVTSRDEKGYPQVERVPVTVKAQSSTTAVIEGAGIEDGTEVMIGGGAGGPSQGAAMDAPSGATSGATSGSGTDATSDTTSSKDSK